MRSFHNFDSSYLTPQALQFNHSKKVLMFINLIVKTSVDEDPEEAFERAIKAYKSRPLLP